MAGRWYDNEWEKAEDTATILRKAQGILESFLSGFDLDLSKVNQTNPLLHPGQQLSYTFKDQTVATIGVVRPELQKHVGLKTSLVYAEVNLDFLTANPAKNANPEIVDFPAIKWELTFKVPSSMLAGELITAVEKLAPKFLEDIQIISSFKKADEDFRRISYRFLFQDKTKTLSNEEVDKIVDSMRDQLKKKHNLDIVS